jgi:hypothetical protein
MCINESSKLCDSATEVLYILILIFQYVIWLQHSGDLREISRTKKTDLLYILPNEFWQYVSKEDQHACELDMSSLTQGQHPP